MRVKRAGLLTKLVILIVLVYAAISLLGLRNQIAEAEATRSDLAAQLAQQRQRVAGLADDIAGSADPQKQEEAARDNGLVLQDELVLQDISG